MPYATTALDVALEAVTAVCAAARQLRLECEMFGNGTAEDPLLAALVQHLQLVGATEPEHHCSHDAHQWQIQGGATFFTERVRVCAAV